MQYVDAVHCVVSYVIEIRIEEKPVSLRPVRPAGVG